MAGSSSSSSSYTATAKKTSASQWQDRLAEACRGYNIEAPAFQIFSDRRGGRTAWSSRVSIYGSVFTARYWYDGKNINNAREDAAEMAVAWLTGGSNPNSPSTSRAGW
ncbi:hypothetical protein F503_00107 [Ophiostoma piceae UAMH 11346]|uniref:DRBM domain-containing protein n=1 Tax=Ophiostoma piceae (strain UAMH 11346) TaxID=1262450 RepID=S3CF60_OPHP1|nr:hypothetical protein F503_00107 [Ophiostoma piceae UAMH 11346]